MGDGHAPGPSGREDVLGADWESHRPAVFGVAYRLLGSVADAEDMTQDVWLRAAGADLRDVGDPRAWLVTVAARRSYDILRSARCGELALVFHREGRVYSVDTLQITDGLITAYRRVINPDKLSHV